VNTEHGQARRRICSPGAGWRRSGAAIDAVVSVPMLLLLLVLSWLVRQAEQGLGTYSFQSAML
jgi:hypothetical protein